MLSRSEVWAPSAASAVSACTSRPPSAWSNSVKPVISTGGADRRRHRERDAPRRPRRPAQVFLGIRGRGDRVRARWEGLPAPVAEQRPGGDVLGPRRGPRARQLQPHAADGRAGRGVGPDVEPVRGQRLERHPLRQHLHVLTVVRVVEQREARHRAHGRRVPARGQRDRERRRGRVGRAVRVRRHARRHRDRDRARRTLVRRHGHRVLGAVGQARAARHVAVADHQVRRIEGIEPREPAC